MWFLLCVLAVIIQLFFMPLLIGIVVVLGGLIARFNGLICRNRVKVQKRTKTTFSNLWDTIGWIWYGYEIKGLENIPRNSSSIAVFYHGAIPVDIYFLLAKMHLTKTHEAFLVADRFVFKIPGGKFIGINDLAAYCNVSEGTYEECLEHLKNNETVVLSPGGAYEAQFSDNSYEILWKNRIGFAKLALDAKAPIIPVFTKNIRAAFYSIGFGAIMKKIYMKLKIPIAPMLGVLPVKLVTIIGEPIPYDASLSPEALRDKVAVELQKLIAEHQEIPGSVWKAFLERFR